MMLENKSYTVICREKKFYHQKLGEIKLPKSNRPYLTPPPLKSQMFDTLEMWLLKTAFIIAHMNQRKPF